MRYAAALVSLVALALFSPPQAAAQNDVGIVSWERFSLGTAVVHEWSRLEGEDLTSDGYFVGITPSYNLLYPTATNQATPDLSIISSVFWGVDRSELRARLGLSYLFPIGGASPRARGWR